MQTETGNKQLGAAQSEGVADAQSRGLEPASVPYVLNLLRRSILGMPLLPLEKQCLAVAIHDLPVRDLALLLSELSSSTPGRIDIGKVLQPYISCEPPEIPHA